MPNSLSRHLQLLVVLESLRGDLLPLQKQNTFKRKPPYSLLLLFFAKVLSIPETNFALNGDVPDATLHAKKSFRQNTVVSLCTDYIRLAPRTRNQKERLIFSTTSTSVFSDKDFLD